MSTFNYFPHTEEDIRAMLDRIGASSLDELYSDVPQECLYKGEYDLPDAMSEQQVRDFILVSVGNIGFLNDLRRMNVAITRARMKLILLGNKATLCRSPFYKKLESYIESLNV